MATGKLTQVTVGGTARLTFRVDSYDPDTNIASTSLVDAADEVVGSVDLDFANLTVTGTMVDPHLVTVELVRQVFQEGDIVQGKGDDPKCYVVWQMVLTANENDAYVDPGLVQAARMDEFVRIGHVDLDTLQV